METKNLIKIALVGILTVTNLLGCGKDSKNSNGNTYTSAYQCYTASGSAVSNSYCSDQNNYYCLSGTSQVANSYCTSSTSSSNYQCYTTSGTAVTNSYCVDTTNYYCRYGTSTVSNTYCTSGTSSTATTQCVGWYYFQGGFVGYNYYMPGQYYCYANTAGRNNCSGVTMTSLNQGSYYGQQIVCP